MSGVAGETSLYHVKQLSLCQLEQVKRLFLVKQLSLCQTGCYHFVHHSGAD